MAQPSLLTCPINVLLHVFAHLPRLDNTHECPPKSKRLPCHAIATCELFPRESDSVSDVIALALSHPVLSNVYYRAFVTHLKLNAAKVPRRYAGDLEPLLAHFLPLLPSVTTLEVAGFRIPRPPAQPFQSLSSALHAGIRLLLRISGFHEIDLRSTVIGRSLFYRDARLELPEAAAHCARRVKTLIIHHCNAVGPPHEFLRAFPEIRSISFSNDASHRWGLRHMQTLTEVIGELRGLTEVNLRCQVFGDATNTLHGLLPLRGSLKVVRINLVYACVKVDLSVLGELETLEVLEVRDSLKFWGDAFLDHAYNGFRSRSLHFGDEVGVKVLGGLGRFGRLKELSLLNCYGLSEQSFMLIPESVDKLTLAGESGSGLEDLPLESGFLDRLHCLKTLRVMGRCKRLSLAITPQLARRLVSLYLSHVQMEWSVEKLQEMVLLRDLFIGPYGVKIDYRFLDSALLMAVLKLPCLSTLSIHNSDGLTENFFLSLLARLNNGELALMSHIKLSISSFLSCLNECSSSEPLWRCLRHYDRVELYYTAGSCLQLKDNFLG